MVNEHIQCHILRKPTWTIDYQGNVDFKSNVLFPIASKWRHLSADPLYPYNHLTMNKIILFLF